MPRFSAFTPFGQLRFSSKKSHSQIFYESLFAAYGGEENFRKTGLQGARLYATAMVLGHARYTLDRAGNQFDPLKVGELLPIQEFEHGIIPPKGATIADRRRS
ncbi:MAG TPA: hypothetical protein VHO25_24325, partial [Polyangiaceae bacterium]|nr:hypothetical protein [Polyangiaceae bacterium]